MDYFSKWPEAYNVPDQEAAKVYEALIEGIFSRFGVPAEFCSDPGCNFKSQLFTEMCSPSLRRTTSLTTQSSGLVECFTRMLGAQLLVVVSKNDYLKLPLILLAFRTAT